MEREPRGARKNKRPLPCVMPCLGMSKQGREWTSYPLSLLDVSLSPWQCPIPPTPPTTLHTFYFYNVREARFAHFSLLDSAFSLWPTRRRRYSAGERIFWYWCILISLNRPQKVRIPCVSFRPRKIPTNLKSPVGWDGAARNVLPLYAPARSWSSQDLFCTALSQGCFFEYEMEDGLFFRYPHKPL